MKICDALYSHFGMVNHTGVNEKLVIKCTPVRLPHAKMAGDDCSYNLRSKVILWLFHHNALNASTPCVNREISENGKVERTI